MCYQHLTSPEPDGASNADIGKLVDSIVPPILAHIRAKHGIQGCGFVLPADVHDYLYDAGAISGEMFDDVFGGSILDAEHLGRFLNAFEAVPKGARAAAAMLFKEHVVCVLRVGDAYHFVDSLPSDEGRGMGTRTICADIHVLRSYLLTYATNRLAGRDAAYHDAHEWDDIQGEFDPRVFQAYLWHNTP